MESAHLMPTSTDPPTSQMSRQQADERGGVTVGDEGSSSDPRVRRLERELEQKEAHLQAVIDHYEVLLEEATDEDGDREDLTTMFGFERFAPVTNLIR